MKTTPTLARALAFLLFFIPALSFANDSDAAFQLYCPDDVWVNCGDEIWDLSIYGHAYYTDYNGTYPAGTPYVHYNLNSCNTGTIVRTWTVWDNYGHSHSCQQTIYVGGGSFNHYHISWPPQDYVLEGCYANTHPDYLPYPYDYPRYDYLSCSQIGITYSDQIFTISPTCKKLLRKWTVIDWCQYNPYWGGNNGIWTYYQVIKLIESDPPDVYCPDDVTIWADRCYDGYVDLPPLTLGETPCGGDFEISNDSPHANGNGANVSGRYPLGRIKVTYTIHYGCGSKDFCSFYITVKEKKPPAPICYGNIAVALMPVFEDDYDEPVDGMVEVWAKDLDKGSYDVCGNGPLRFSFSSDPDDGFRTFTCADVGENEVEMWVTDLKGNQSFCIVVIDVQNNGANIPDCEPEPDEPLYAEIGGHVSRLAGGSAEGVQIALTGLYMDTSYVTTYDTSIVVTLDSFQNLSGAWLYYEVNDTAITETTETVVEHMTKEWLTSDDGQYHFDALPMYADYEVHAAKQSAHGENITMDDVFFLYNYFMQQVEIDDPYMLLAADVDRSGVVDVDDVILLYELVRGDIEALPVESNWIFVSAHFEWPEGEDVMSVDFEDSHFLEALDAIEMDRDFVAIQLGDLVKGRAEMQKAASRFDLEQIEALLTAPDAQDQIVGATPNPFSDGVAIQLTSSRTQYANLVVRDIQGRVLLEEGQMLQPGLQSWAINLDRITYTGMLTYTIRTDSGMQFTGKLVRVK